MRFSIVAVGRIKDQKLRHVVDEYKTRLGHYVGVREIEIEDGSAEAVDALVSRHAKDDILVSLDSRGKELDSIAFSRFIDKLTQQGKGNVAFALGGKEGLGKVTVDRSAHVLSLSQMTLPHRLARLFLYEQLYRAMTLLRGEPYGL